MAKRKGHSKGYSQVNNKFNDQLFKRCEELARKYRGQLLYEEAVEQYYAAYKWAATPKDRVLMLLTALDCASKGQLREKEIELCKILVAKFSVLSAYLQLLCSWRDLDKGITFIEERAQQMCDELRDAFKDVPNTQEVRLVSRLVEAVAEKDYPATFEIAGEWIVTHTYDDFAIIFAFKFFEFVKDLDPNRKIYSKLHYDFIERIRGSIDQHKYYAYLVSAKESVFDFESFMQDMWEKFDSCVKGGNPADIPLATKLATDITTKDTYYGCLTDEQYITAVDMLCKTNQVAPPPNEINTHYFRRINVGYMSYDFRRHNVAKYLAVMFAFPPANTGLKTIGYYTHNQEDSYTKYFEEHMDVFKRVKEYTDKQLHDEIVNDNLDIFFDLQGNSVGLRWFIKQTRFAPIQVFYLGMAMTTGSTNMDYCLADEYTTPSNEKSAAFMTEKPLYMPHTADVYAFPLGTITETEPPCVRNGYITFGNMNNPSKFSAKTLKMWAMVLDRVPTSRLLIQLPGTKMDDFRLDCLKKRFARFGMDMDRVEFGEDYGNDNYYKMYNERMDVMLDTVEFNGATTTYEALYMGVPVLVYKHYRGSGRVGYKIIKLTGILDDCIADTFEEYAENAYNISQNFDRLTWLKQNLRDHLLANSYSYKMEWFRPEFDNVMRGAFLKYCYEHKKPFDAAMYENRFDELMRDSLRAPDIIIYEINKEESDAPIADLIDEYITMMQLVLERLLDEYEDDENALKVLQKIIDAITLLVNTTDKDNAVKVLTIIRDLHMKFAW